MGKQGLENRNIRDAEMVIDYKELYKIIREKLNAIKVKSGLTMRQISEASGVPEGTVSNVFSGNTKAPGYATVNSILKALDQSLDAFWKEVYSPAIIIPLDECTPMDVATIPEVKPLPPSDGVIADNVRAIAVQAIREASESERCAFIMAQYKDEYARLEAYHIRGFDRLEAEHTRLAESMRAEHEKEIERAERHTKWWRGLSFALIGMIVVISLWLAWDLSHPKIGLVQYSETALQIDTLKGR